MKALCPTCNGSGKIPDPKRNLNFANYCALSAVTMQMVMCETCSGSGWVDVDPTILFNKFVEKKQSNK